MEEDWTKMTEDEIREFCRAEMKQKNMTYRHTATGLYVNRHTLSGWLTGRSTFPVGGAVALLDKFGYELTIRKKGGVE